jgi:acyl-coenzyme A thioesterase PaaI-like protein
MDSKEIKAPAWPAIEVSEGEWQGFSCFRGGDPFEDLSGPFYFQKQPAGGVLCAFRAEARHMNGAGFMHGGCLMTFADYAMFVIAHERLGELQAVTATLNGEFIGAVAQGSLVEARGELIKARRSLLFVRGLISVARDPVLTFSGVLKRVERG